LEVRRRFKLGRILPKEKPGTDRLKPSDSGTKEGTKEEAAIDATLVIDDDG
jgi:hypothetical protein